MVRRFTVVHLWFPGFLRLLFYKSWIILLFFQFGCQDFRIYAQQSRIFYPFPPSLPQPFIFSYIGRRNKAACSYVQCLIPILSTIMSNNSHVCLGLAAGQSLHHSVTILEQLQSTCGRSFPSPINPLTSWRFSYIFTQHCIYSIRMQIKKRTRQKNELSMPQTHYSKVKPVKTMIKIHIYPN